MELVEAKKDWVFCDSVLLAQKFKMKHAYVVRVIHTIQKDFVNLRVAVNPIKIITENRVYRGQEYKVYLLDFQSSLFLIMRLKNPKNVQHSLCDSIAKNIKDASNLFESIKDIDVDLDVAELFVYVAQEEKSGRYKIGISKNPKQRIKQLQIGNPEKLELVLTYRAKKEKHLDEVEAHQKFVGHRLQSEWFDSDIDLSLLENNPI